MVECMSVSTFVFVCLSLCLYRSISVCVSVCRLGRASVWQRLSHDSVAADDSFSSSYRSSSVTTDSDDLRVRLERKHRRR